jgi:predicted TIM-barrel fold metal-dependent hydrolase
MRDDVDFQLYDADNHYYEPRDCFTRHMPRNRLEDAIRVIEDEGRERIVVGDRPFTFLAEFFREKKQKPGSLSEMLRNLSSRDAGHDNPFLEDIQPAWENREARLQLMDQQRVEAAVVFPSLGVCVEHFMKENVERTYLNLHSFNQWLHEEWGFSYHNRIYATPLLSLLDLDRAVTELEWVLDHGATIVHLRPGPVAGKSPADPYFDPFWARVNEAGISVAFHISESSYNEMFSVAWGEEPNPTSHRQSALQWTCFYGDRPIMDTVASLTFYNLFGRFPNVRIASVENGSLWVPYLLRAMDKMKGMGRNGPWPGGYVKGKPSEIVRGHLFVSPYHEEDIVGLVDLIGPTQVIFGSDYPHAEGLAEPVEYADRLASLPPDDVRRIMRENTRELLTPIG